MTPPRSLARNWRSQISADLIWRETNFLFNVGTNERWRIWFVCIRSRGLLACGKYSAFLFILLLDESFLRKRDISEIFVLCCVCVWGGGVVFQCRPPYTGFVFQRQNNFEKGV